MVILKIEMIDEYNTSKVCSKCLNKKLEKINEENVNSHFVKRCQSCFTIWNRDINSSRNMIDISLHKDRPIILCRPKNDVASFTPASLVQIQDLAV